MTAAATADTSTPSVAAARGWTDLATISRTGTLSNLSGGVPVADTVLIASGAVFADALPSSALAGTVHAPLLLTGADGNLTADALSELRRLHPSRVYVVGGPAAVTPAAEAAARAAARSADGSPTSVRRLSGTDRYASAAAVAAQFHAGVGTVYLASGESYADSMTAGAVVGRTAGPLLLTHPAVLTSSTRAALVAARAKGATKVVLVGGPAAIAPAVQTAVAQVVPGATVVRARGANRYDVAANLSAMTFAAGSRPAVVLVDGDSWTRGLPTGAYAATFDKGMLLAYPTGVVPVSVRREIARLGAAVTAVPAGGAPAASRPVASDAGLRAIYSRQSDYYLREAERLSTQRATSVFVEATLAKVYAQRYGWDYPAARRHWANVMADRHPDGGWGLSVPVQYPGSTNPVSTTYTVTISDHVGVALLSAYDAGVATRTDVQRAVDALMAMPRRTYADGSVCMAYDNARYHATLSDAAGYCVYNASDSAAWFLAQAADRGIDRPGQLTLVGALLKHTRAAVRPDGSMPYSSDTRLAGTTQDLDHYSLDAEVHLVHGAGMFRRGPMLSRAVGAPLTSNGTDVLGKLRMLPYASAVCASLTGSAKIMEDYAQREWHPANRLDIMTVRYAQLADRTLVAAGSC